MKLCHVHKLSDIKINLVGEIVKLTEVKLKDISKNNRGYYGIGASAVDYDENKYTYLRITDINDDGTLNKTTLMSVNDKKACDFLLKENDIVFARTGASAGRNYFYDGEIKNIVFAGFLIKFSLDKEKVNPRFIKYYCLSPKYKNWIVSSLTGSTRPNINEKQLSEMPIILPEREYQNRGVKVLDAIIKKIELNNQINDNLLEIGDTLYKEYFEKEKMPNEWEVCKLKDVACNFDYKRKPMSSREREEHKGIYPYYGATSIIDYVDDYIFDGIYLLMGEDGTVVKSDGKPVLQYIWGKNWINNHAHVLKGNKISTEHLMFCLRNCNVRDIVTGAVQPKINQENMNNIKIISADERTNNKFEKIIDSIMEQYKSNIEENQNLEQLRDTLLPKLMNGEIDLDKIEI